MDADSRYAMLYAMGDDAFDVPMSEARLTEHFQANVITPMVTRKAHPYFLRRQLDAGMVRPKVYRVFGTYEDALYGEAALASFRVRGPVQGRATVESAVVLPHERRAGIASRVYDVIGEDLRRVGAELWPAAPASMSDDGFLFWWQRRPELVLYYPHRQRLKVPLTLDQHQALAKLDSMDQLLRKVRWARASRTIWPKLLTAAELWLRERRGGG